MISILKPQGCRCAPTAGLKLANAFGVSNCDTTQGAGLKLANAFGVKFQTATLPKGADLKTLKAFVRLKLRIILFNYV